MTTPSAAAERSMPGPTARWLSNVAWVFRKDLLIERATREITTTSAFFACLVAITASVSLHSGADTRVRVAPGVIWISIAFAAVLAVSKSWHREREDGALDGLLVSPLSRSAIFAGKALSIVVFLGVVQIVVVPLSAVLFSVDLLDLGPGIAVISACATPGIAATGTLFGAMTVRTRARDLVLASVLFPLLLPTLLSAVAATRELFSGAPVPELRDYLVIMLVFDGVFVAGGMALFGSLIES
jgi:heme exporter protein B